MAETPTINPFAPKLTFHLQCFIHAAHWYKGYSYPVLARAFDVNSMTIQKICRRTAGYYRHVFGEADRMGVEQMWNKYTKPELEARVENAASERSTMAALGVVKGLKAEGPGIYYIPSAIGGKVWVDIMPYEQIKHEIEGDVEPNLQTGYWVKIGRNDTWGIVDGRTFRNVAEALRYFEEYPPMNL